MSFAKQFLQADTTFLAALSSGGPALDTFRDQWATLCTEYEQARELGHVGDEESAIAYAITSKIAVLSDAFIDLNNESEKITSSLVDTIESTLAQLFIDDEAHDSAPRQGRRVPPSKAKHRLPPHMPLPFAWLLENLHDPYPSSSLKRSWAKFTGVSSRVMDDWFKAIRREIGWVALTKTHFGGSRSLAVSAAGSVFRDEAGQSFTDIPFEAQADFLAMKSKLDSLYLSERGLATASSEAHQESTNKPRSASPDPPATAPATPMPPINIVSELLDEVAPTAPSSPSSLPSTRLPSLVFDRSDSEEESHSPTLSVRSLLDGATIRMAPLGKNSGDRSLKRTRHCYIERYRKDSLESLSPDLPVQSNVPQFLTSRPLCSEFEDRTSTKAPVAMPQTPIPVSQPESDQSQPRSRKRCRSEVGEQAAAKKSRVVRNLPKRDSRRPQTVSVSSLTTTPQAPMEPDVDIIRLLREFEQDFCAQPESSLSGDPLVTSMPVECNLFNFATDEAQPTSGVIPLCTVDMPITAVDNDINWEQLLALVPSKENDDTDALQDRQFDEFLAAFTNSSALAGLENGTSTSDDGTALSAIQVNDIQDALDLVPAAAASPVIASSPPSSEGVSIWEDLFGPEDFLSSFVTEDLQLATLDQSLGDTSDTLGSPSAPDALGETASALPTALVS